MRGAAGPLRLRHRVLDAIREHDLWKPGDRVAVAVSGGLDSTCLLDLLWETRDAHGARLTAVTVDHGTRPGSAADADHVADTAAALGLPCTRVALALGPDASEADCRDGRYAVLDALDTDVVALAHHRDDQAATVLLQLLRGAGTRGMAAMAWRRGRYARPFLDTPRSDLVAWATTRGLAWREDPTNDDPRFLRNRVSAEVLPVLEALRPGAADALARSAAVAADDDAALDALSRERAPDTLPLPAAWVARAWPALVARAVHRWTPGITSAQVQALRSCAARGGGVVQLPGGVRWVVEDGGCDVVGPSAEESGR